MRKLALIILAALLIAAPAFAGGSSEKSSIIVSTWGLSEDNLWTEVYEPFEEEYNTTVILDVGNGQERFTKLQNDPNSQVDVIELAQKNTADAIAAGVTDPIRPEEIECFDSLIPAAQEIIRSGSGAPYTLNSICIIYDRDAAGIEIKEWEDLWDPALRGKITIPDITTTFGPAFVEMAGFVAGTAPKDDNADAAFKALEALKPNVVRTYSRSSDAVNLFQTGEIAVAVIGDFGVPVVTGAVDGLEVIVPESGTWANFNVINITDKCRNRDLAVQYINYRLSAETQTRTAGVLNEAPTNGDVVLSPEVAANLTVGEVAARAKSVDFSYVNTVIDDWVDRYNRIMNVR